MDDRQLNDWVSVRFGIGIFTLNKRTENGRILPVCQWMSAAAQSIEGAKCDLSSDSSI